MVADHNDRGWRFVRQRRFFYVSTVCDTDGRANRVWLVDTLCYEDLHYRKALVYRISYGAAIHGIELISKFYLSQEVWDDGFPFA